MSHCDWFTWHVGAWSGVSAGEVVREVAEVVGKIAEVVGEVAEVVGEVAEVVGEITEVPDADVVTSQPCFDIHLYLVGDRKSPDLYRSKHG